MMAIRSNATGLIAGVETAAWLSRLASAFEPEGVVFCCAITNSAKGAPLCRVHSIADAARYHAVYAIRRQNGSRPILAGALGTGTRWALGQLDATQLAVESSNLCA